MFKKFLYIYFVVLFVFVFFTTSFCSNVSNIIISNKVYSFSDEFLWPVPGYTTITSQFGNRVAPTSGASSYHSGIDIAAPSGSNIIACFSGKVIYTGFYGAGGFTVMIEGNEYTALYCHVSPNFIVNIGQTINKGDIVAKVGPKNVYNVSNNPYKDKNGKPTNGATTGPHLHFSLKKDGKAVNPLSYISSSSS